MNIYCFSGLGADDRIFAQLEIPSVKLHYVQWIKALPDETLADYALRLGQTIVPVKPYCLMGVSFGGMLASELSKVLEPEYTFLISGALSSREINPLIRLTSKTRLHHLLPDSLFRHPNIISHRAFGLRTKSEKHLFSQIMRNTDIRFMKWAIGAIMNWRPDSSPEVVRIHGDKDFIIPCKSQKIDHLIEGGTHFCIWQQAERISRFISSVLQFESPEQSSPSRLHLLPSKCS